MFFMKKRLLSELYVVLFFVCFVFPFAALAQQPPAKNFPSDNELLALVNKYLQTPVKKTATPQGDVFLQRDMAPYLKTTVQAPTVDAAQKDHGHDHKDDMLREFLNRPHPDVATMEKYFQQAAAEFGVPAVILKATAQVQSNWAQVSESIYGSWGIMGLIENKYVQQISKAASLLQVSAAAVKNDARTNIRAAAVLLAHYQKGKPASANLEDWFDATQSLTGLWDADLKKSLALRVYEVIREGSKTVTLWGEIIFIEPTNFSLSKSITEAGARTSSSQRTQAVDYPAAVANFTTCNYNSRPAGSVIKYYFVHYVATGTYQGAINWFKDCASSVSAHYVVRNSDGEVSQVVAEADRAWSQGVTEYNDLGIGVEHEVLATNLAMWDSDPMLTSAANLAKNVCNRQGIPKLRRTVNGTPGIYGHSDVRATDCPNMTAARWTAYLNKVMLVNVAAPTLHSITSTGSGTQVTATWKANTEPELAGYRLYYATNDALTNWALVADETTLTSATTSVTLNSSQFTVPPTGDVYHFRLTAVATDGVNPKVESNSSDVYSRSSNTTGPKVLIVDGFDRFGTGSYPNYAHSFATRYFTSLRLQASLQVSTVADEKVVDGSVVLSNYDIVIWIAGDESGSPVVLSASERTALKNYLDNGGKLLISGSEIAYTIGRSASTNYDLAFMNGYLKASYVNDGSASYTPATGIAGTHFEGLVMPFGITYPEDFPDGINPVTGATAIFNYSVSPNRGGVAYKGTFGSGTVPGGVIYLSFPLETAVDSNMTNFMGKALSYFDVPVVTYPTANNDVATAQTRIAKRVNVLANDATNGVSFNPATVTIVTQPSNGTVTTDNKGNITYVSNTGFTGTDSYQYKVQNTSGNFSNVATVSITVVANVACDPNAPDVDVSAPKRELRGAWVSTVSNIDWPSAKTLTTAQQQAELITILSQLSQTGINTVFLQVRPESDALYQSSLEPWSHWLTNSQGTAPNPFWDPLQFAIDEAHKRGMELHAWINPYRAKQSSQTLAPNHVAVLHPDWTFTAGTLLMLDPGLPQVRQHVTDVIADIATRYDVDGIHFDDYFYPSANFTNQDQNTYLNHNPTGIDSISKWRRNNVNMLIAKVYDTLAVINAASGRNIVFGVSPFGIWKSGTPPGITGTSSFSAMYCDPITWLQEGKVDYVAPQLYWKITGGQDYNALSKWWNDQGAFYNRHIYPGLALYKMVDGTNNWAATEIENQISLNRDQTREQVKGQILFSTKQLKDNAKSIRTVLQNGQFRYKAIAPAMTWKDAVCPNAPVNVRRDGDTLRWDAPSAAPDGDLPKRYIVYQFADATEAVTHKHDGQKIYAVVYANKVGLPAGATSGFYMVTSLDDANNESENGTVIILPITGLDLQVKLSGNTAIIDWRTITETNTRHFEVERSADGTQFSRIASVGAAGNSSTPKSYRSHDFLSAEGTYYYRIKTVDLDSKFYYSDVKSVVYSGGNTYVVGPNPFESFINISNLKGAKRVEVIDQSGRVFLSRVLSHQSSVQLPTGQIPAGLYYLRTTKADGSSSMTKMVKL